MSTMTYQKTQCFEFPEHSEIKLFNIFKLLNIIYGATYMSYTFDLADTLRFSFRTDSRWAYIYHNETVIGKSLIELCPLDVASREKKNSLILWDLYHHRSQPKIYREIMGRREDIGLRHGITLSTYFGKHHDAIAIATEEQKIDLSTNVLLDKNAYLLKKSLLECRQEITGLFNQKIGPQ
ncbi:MAG: hypothetical protein H0U73_01075 [Tatlockia sp.]|nr:hypothetical protein [Tatlockia sp.]